MNWDGKWAESPLKSGIYNKLTSSLNLLSFLLSIKSNENLAKVLFDRSNVNENLKFDFYERFRVFSSKFVRTILIKLIIN